MKEVLLGLTVLALMVTLGCSACEQSRQKEAAPTLEAPAAVPDKACFDQCMARNQMRATAIERIEADCRKSCGETP